MLPARLLAVLPACLLAVPCPHPCGSRSGGDTRTPPFPCSSPCISGSASRACSDGVSHTRPDVASPASVTVHSIASIVEPGLGGGPTLALLRSFSRADFTSPFPTWRLTEDRSCSSRSPTQHHCCFLHCSPFSVSRRHPTNMLPRCYPPTSLTSADEGISVISIITAEFSVITAERSLSCLPSLEELSMTSPILSWECRQRACAWSHACASQAQLNTTLCPETGMEESQTL